MLDCIVRGATIADGTGAALFRADLGVAGDRIAAIGDLSAEKSAREFDARGLVAAPGFIDVHSHAEGRLLKTPHLPQKTMQGFTTELLMPDGFGYAPFTPATAREWMYYLRSVNCLQLTDYDGWLSQETYLGRLEGRIAQNVATHVPFGNLRANAAGWGRAPADDMQRNAMIRSLETCMASGAVGLSTGLDYICECFASTGEIARVAAGMRAWNGVYVTHVRYKIGTTEAVKEAVEIGKLSGAPVHISHLKETDPREADKLLQYIDRIAVNEVEFSFDVYPYAASSTMLNSLLPYAIFEKGPIAATAALRKQGIRDQFAEILKHRALGLSEMWLAWVPGKDNARFEGMNLQQFVDANGQSPADALADFLIEEGLAVLLVFRRGEDSRVDPFVAHPRGMIASDGIYFDDGWVHPRAYGTAPRALGPLVRDRRLFSLGEAVRKLSGFPAKRFGLKDRGVIREGAFADLAIFDPATIHDPATYENPRQLAVGMRHVLVNGVPVVTNGTPIQECDKWPGRVLKYNR